MRRMGASWAEILRQAEFGLGRAYRRSTIMVWSMGQGGSLDLVEALLRVMGRDRSGVGLEFSSWAGEGADIRQVEAWVEQSRLGFARWVVDQSFEGRDPELAGILRRRFGDGCIPPARMHAKCIVLTSGDWSIAAITSASLDPAQRLEHWVISDDPAFVGMVGASLDAAVRVRDMERAGLVDASMVRGTPCKALARLHQVSSDESIRGCSIHGKFWRYGDLTCLTPANLNQHPRVESYVFNRDPAVAAATDGLVDLIWERQAPGDVWLRGRGLRVNRVLVRRGSADV